MTAPGFPGLRSEVSRVLGEDFVNLQVLHEALEQPEGLAELAAHVAHRLGEEAVLISHELRQFRQATERDMQRERRFFHRRLVRPRLEEHGWDTETLQEGYQEILRKEALPVRTVRKSTLSRNLVLEVGNPLQTAEEERIRWANNLAEYIVEARLPVMRIIENAEVQTRIWGRIFGSRRAKTLRNRCTTWKRFHLWLTLNRSRSWPRQIGDIVDYLEGRIEDGCGPAVPQGLMGSLALLETVGRVDDSVKLSKDSTLLGIIRNMQMELQQDSPPRRPARPYIIAMMIGLELVVCNVEQLPYARLIAWVMLLMVWMTLRADDVQWIDGSRLRLDGVSLRVTLMRTKTTGPGRRALEVPAFVARDVGFSGRDWLATGWDLYHTSEFRWERDYFLPAPAKDWSRGARKYLSTESLTSYMRYVTTLVQRPLRGIQLRQWFESGEPLLSGEASNFFSGHSPRHWLPTHAANLGIGKEQRDFLGRWQAGAQESNAYILSAKQAIMGIQREVNRAICVGHAGLTEGELIDELKAYSLERGVPQRDGRWFHVMLRLPDMKYGLQQEFPAVKVPHVDDEDEAWEDGLMRGVPTSEGPSGSSGSKEGKEMKFWVSISRRTGFRRLHKLHGCGVMHWTVAAYEAIDEPKKVSADAWCKVCFRQELTQRGQDDDDSSSSGSSSSTEESVDEHEVPLDG
eukprot:s4599_g5.t1